MTINGYEINGAEALDEEDYQLWLRNPSSAIAHLVEIDYHGTSAVYPNWVRYTLKSSDRSDLSFVGYPDRVKSIGNFTRQIGERFSGTVTASIGEITFNNMDGSLDAWHNLSIDGQRVRVLHGHPDWAYERFRTVYECIAECVASSTWDTLTVRLRGIDYKANLPIQTNLIPDTSGANAESNVPVPLAYGDVFNITPAIADGVNLVYQWNDGAVTSVSEVRDSGVLFQVWPLNWDSYGGLHISTVNAGTNTLTSAVAHGFYEHTRISTHIPNLAPPYYWTWPAPIIANQYYYVIANGLTTTDFRLSLTRGGAEIDITGATIDAYITGYHWDADLTTGEILLDSSPAGILTLDGIAGSTLASDIVIAALGATNIDNNSKNRFDATCPQTMGIYIKERRNRLEVADEVMQGIGAWYGYSREGMLQFGRVKGQPATYDFALGEDDFIPNTFHPERMIPPEKRHMVQYQKNYTNQKGILADAVGVSQIEQYAEYWRIAYSTDFSVSEPNTIGADEGSGGEEYHLLATFPDAIPSLMKLGGQAKTEAARLDAMYYGWGVIFSGQTKRIGIEVDIGMVVKVTHSRYGLSGGMNMTCVYADYQPSADTVDLKFFVALDAYTPGQL